MVVDLVATDPLVLGLSRVLALWTLAVIRRALLDRQAGFQDFLSGWSYGSVATRFPRWRPLDIEVSDGVARPCPSPGAEAIKSEGRGTQSLQQTQRSQRSEHSQQGEQQQQAVRMQPARRIPPSGKAPSPTR